MRVLAALPQTQPNYMDAAYYLVGGQRLAQGFGFNDPYVWHYLDQPIGLPHPSHLYWMPLPSIMVAISQSILGVNYRAAQLPFVLLSAMLPVLAYLIAWRISGGAASRVDCGTADYLQPVLFAVLGRAGKFCAVRSVRRVGVILGDRRVEVAMAGGWSLRRFGTSLTRRWRVVVSTAAACSDQAS